LLAVVDTVHLLTSILSFSLPTLHTPFLYNTYQYTLPYTLPIAQVYQNRSCLEGGKYLSDVTSYQRNFIIIEFSHVLVFIQFVSKSI
jgi:hypothetical protein